MTGCPVCNTKSHSYDACPTAQNFDTLAHFKWLISNRARRPCIRTRIDWRNLAADAAASSLDACLDQSLPWSNSFALYMFKPDAEGRTRWDSISGYDYSTDNAVWLPAQGTVRDVVGHVLNGYGLHDIAWVDQCYD